VARSTTTFYQVSGPNTIVVVPDTQAKRREYLDEVLQTFYVQNGDLKEIVDTLRVVGDIRQLSPNTATNAIAVRDTAERVHAAGRLISSIDKAKPETVVDVLILEVDRSRLREYGLQMASSGSTGIDGAVALKDETQTVASLRNLTDANIVVSGLPALYYRLLKTDSNTRTLANPHIRITDGTAAVEKFGEEVPVPTVTIGGVSTGGVNTVPIQSNTYRNVGVNLTITPRVHANDEVTLVLNAELSSISGTGFGGFPTFGTRSIATTIRLKDGETGILAGLIRDDDRVVRSGIPGLSDLPAIGHLFAHNQKQRDETDVVLMLTPHIIRVLDLTEEDLRPIRVPREGSGAAISEGGPIVPSPIIRGGGPGGVTGGGGGGVGRGGRE
jgi:general secretion pathway protein D